MAIDWEYYKKKAKKIDEENYRKNASNDIAPVRTQTPTSETKNSTEPKWYDNFLQLGDALSDGWQFGDITKTLLGTNTDMATNLLSGIVGWGEEAIKAGAAAAGTVTEKLGMDDTTEKIREFVATDLYDANTVSKQILSSNFIGTVPGLSGLGNAIKTIFTLEDFLNSKKEVDNGFGGKTIVREDNSIFADDADALLQSVGESGAKMGISALSGGLPISDIITGITVYGSQAEQAIKEDATFSKATGSALISAAAEILFEKLSGGIKFGGVTLDDGLTRLVSKNISNVALKNGINFFKDFTGEALEEVLTEFVSKLGTALYKEEDLTNILFSEDALQDYIKAGFSGGLMGGLFNAPNALKGTASGVDYKTGLTKTEQAVFDKEYNNRIAEATKDGKKASAKDKSNIYNSVMDDIEKGRISIDTIESVLGGETYKQYQSAVEKDNQMKELQKEYDSLYQMKSGDKSDAQADHQAELKQQLEDYKNNSQLTQLKDKLSKEVSEMAKVSKLSESYNEKTRRSQAFEADLTQYDEKHQGTYKRAIESGILNNTNRTHEFVDLLAKLETDKGVLFDFTNNAKIKETGFAIEGKQVNGYVQGNNIAINIDSTSALNKVVGHEIAHVLEGTELYTELANVVKELATTKGEYDSKLQSITKLYEGIEDANIENELTADLIGEYLFTDSEFINRLSSEKPTLFQKIFDEIKYLCKVATAGSKEAKQLEKVKKTFEEAYRQKNNTATDDGVKKNSIRLTKEDLNDYLRAGNRKNQNKLSAIENNQKIVLTSEAEIKEYINNSINKKTSGITVAYGKVNERLSTDVEKYSNGKINIKNNYLEIVPYDMQHSYEQHHIAKEKGDIDLEQSDFEKIPEYFDEYDELLYAITYASGQTRICVSKRLPQGRVLIIETVSKSRGAVQFKNAIGVTEEKYKNEYLAKYNKKRSDENSRGNESSNISLRDSITSNNSVPQENTTVNNNSMQEERKNSLGDENIAPVGNNVYGEDIKLQTTSAEDIAPIGENVIRKTTPSESNIPDDYAPTADDIQKQNTPKIDLFVKSNKTVESEQATVLKETTPVEQSTIDEKAVERLTRKVIDGLDIGKTKKNRTAIGEIIKSFGDNYSATSKDALYDAVKKKFGTTYVDSVINKATDLIYNNVTEHREATSKVDKVTKDIESANISNKVKTEIKNQLTSAYEKIEAEYNIDKNNLVNELNARKSQLETDTADKNHFFKKYAGELYSELKQLKKGVRASEDLSYLLNSLDSKNWKPLVTALINAKNAPEGVVNENSEIERVVRELLNEKFDSYVDELNNFDSTAQEELEKLETKAEDKRNYARLAVNGKLVREIMDAEQVSLMGDTSTWKDKKKGFWYKTETEKRNFEDIVKDSKGKADIEKAKALNDYFMGTYNHNEAELKRESNKIKKDFIDLKLNKHEDVFVQMKGEFLHNPHTELTQHDIDTFLNLYGKNIDEAKVDKAIDMARETYDSLIERMNEVLVAHGMKPIEYRRGYFPHFSEVEKSKFAKLAEKFLNWKTQNNDIPTDIAGLTESFKPNRSWQSFNKRRISDETDYSFSKGFDRYLQGSLDWIYHIDDIMKRRVFENRIRYDHSDNGIKEQIQEIYKNNEFDTNEKQEQIDLVFREAQNPLNNFIIDFRTRTNTLAGKKSSMDRGMEEFTNRKFYSTMNNISNRVTANMVAGSISSALTNFIPITQSWGEVSPISSLRAMSDTIRSAVKDDGVVDKSDFLTNRLKNPENLYQTGWDKANEVAGWLMEVVDGFTSQTVWRSKYLENLSKGMSEAESIKNADEFAEGLIAGRSRGNMPTIFDAKSPIAKTFTAFQLEVNNQYRYLFKDMPKNLADESKIKLAKGYAAVFIGAHVYNMAYSALVGRNAAFDPIDIIKELVGDLFDDEEEELGENVGNAVLGLTENILDETPFVGGVLGTGGRIPLSSALPYGDGIWEAYEGTVTDLSEGDLENLTKEWLSSVGAYVLAPVAGGQIKKSIQGISMFDDDFPIAGSYTDSGKLRFKVEETPGNIAQAALFGQYASKTARQYFDEEHTPLSSKKTEELSALEISMEEYWEYQKGLKKLGEDATLAEKVDFIANLDGFETWQKNIMANNLTDRKTPIDLTGYEAIGDFEEFDFYMKKPEKYAVAKAVGGYDSYMEYSKRLSNITSEKDSKGKTVSGSRKKKVARYINNLDIEFGEKMILYKNEFKGDDTYNAQIVEYLNDRNDITYQEKTTILTELGFKVLSDGTVRW